MGPLSGKVAVVTGGAMGLGEAHVRAMIREGARVVLTDRNAAKGTALANEFKDSALYVKHDVADQHAWTRVVAQTEAVFGPISILVNTCGGCPAIASLDCERRDCDESVKSGSDESPATFGPVIRSMMKSGSGSIITISKNNDCRAPEEQQSSETNFRTVDSTMAHCRYHVRVSTIRAGDVGDGGSPGAPLMLSSDSGFNETRKGLIGLAAKVTKVVLFLTSNEPPCVEVGTQVGEHVAPVYH